MIKSLFGDRAFYKKIIVLLIPIMVQNGITNFVGMLDNIMIGAVGTNQITGVAVANQLIFVFNLCIFGAISGAGIFSAQFYGNSNHEGVRNTFRFKLIFCTALCIGAMALFCFGGEGLIDLYLKGEGRRESIAEIMKYARQYLNIMLVGLIPFTLTQCYSSTLRETGKTLPPMLAGLVAVVVNIILNYCLIFGKFGFPRLGASGAAVATVVSRFVELFALAVWTHRRRDINEFIVGAYRSMRVPLYLVMQIILKGTPLMLNETLWALGIATLNQCYSTRGIAVVAANNISQTFFNVFSVAIMSTGVAIGIVLGQQLGAGETDEAMSTAKKLITFSVLLSVAIAVVFVVLAEFIPYLYNIESDVRFLATRLMQITALALPLEAFVNASYFTLRSGGKSLITFLFDSCFVWCVSVVVANILIYSTGLHILAVYGIIQALNLIKCIIGFVFVKSRKWIKNIVVTGT